MKKSLFILIIVTLILVLSGCKGELKIDDSYVSTSDNNMYTEDIIDPISINLVSLDNEEYSILQAVGVKNSMIFSIDLNNVKVNNVNLWTDHYIDGEFVNSYFNMSSQVSNTSSSSNFKIYFSTSGVEVSKEIWTIALRENKSVSSIRFELKSSEYDSTIIHPINYISTGLNETTDLGMLVRNQGADLFGASNDVNRTIQENKEVYVIRCMFE